MILADQQVLSHYKMSWRESLAGCCPTRPFWSQAYSNLSAIQVTISIFSHFFFGIDRPNQKEEPLRPRFFRIIAHLDLNGILYLPQFWGVTRCVGDCPYSRLISRWGRSSRIQSKRIRRKIKMEYNIYKIHCCSCRYECESVLLPLASELFWSKHHSIMRVVCNIKKFPQMNWNSFPSISVATPLATCSLHHPWYKLRHTSSSMSNMLERVELWWRWTMQVVSWGQCGGAIDARDKGLWCLWLL